jgi:hypothetical protein
MCHRFSSLIHDLQWVESSSQSTCDLIDKVNRRHSHSHVMTCNCLDEVHRLDRTNEDTCQRKSIQRNKNVSIDILPVSSTSSVFRIHCMRSPPVNTLGIFDMKLFTDLIGRPVLSSCIRSNKDSI